MKIKITNAVIKAAALLALSTINSQLSIYAQGSLTPPGAPAPTMKTLDQLDAKLEKRTPISSAPFTINSPGSYYLTANVTVSSGNAITVVANNVTLDLNGFTIASTENPAAAGCAIAVGSSSAVTNVSILNGFISGGVINNGGIYSGPGFGYGVYAPGGNPAVNVRVSGVSVYGCRYYGIFLLYNNTSVQSCNVNTVGSYGIDAQSVSDSVVLNCGTGTALTATTANNCYAVLSGSGDGIFSDTAINCYGSTPSGHGVYAAQSATCCVGTSGSGYGLWADGGANNCFGEASSGTGLYAGEANNCDGSTFGGSGYGIYAATASNCRGSSNGGSYGLYADSAQNCEGVSQTSDGVHTTQIAVGCYGVSYGGAAFDGLYTSGIAMGCSGFSDSGTGLGALIAEVCHGATTSGTAFAVTHNVNSY
jgi:hypothetical protein